MPGVNPDDGETKRPFDRLGAIAVEMVDLEPGLRHLEIYTMRGLLTVLWHGPQDAKHVVMMMGGALGGLLGPAKGLYHHLGRTLAEKKIGSMRVDYREPNALDACVFDVGAAADLANRNGAERFVCIGHSFGGAVAINLAVGLRRRAAGVVTLATQSGGCQIAAELGDVPLLLLHGDADDLLPVSASESVRAMAGGKGELVVLPGIGHLFRGAETDLRRRLEEWIPKTFARTGETPPPS